MTLKEERSGPIGAAPEGLATRLTRYRSFLDLPVASVEWDGAHHFSFYLFSRSDLITGCKFQKKTGGDDGPLTPWELPMTNYHHDYDEKGDDNDERDNYYGYRCHLRLGRYDPLAPRSAAGPKL